jgi:C-terminal peptidase prc
MSKAKLAGALAALVLALIAVVPLRAAEAQSHPHVVLIGISQYGDKQIKPRPHAEADAKALYDLFMNKDYLGVPADHVRLLLGSPDPQRKSEPATHDNILKALRWVAAEAQRDDLVILAFIGQGAPLSGGSGRLCYLAADSTLKDRAKNAVAAADIAQELDKLQSQRFCAFIDVNFKGFDNGPEKMPFPSLGTVPYREFRGASGKEEESAAAPGRAVFLATNGLSESLNLEKQGLFTQVIVDGLKGAADKEGYEADGLVTVDELWEYLHKEIPARAKKLGKTEDEKRQTPWILESPSSHFVLTKNPDPAVQAKVAERLTKLAQLAKEGKISEELAKEGKDLLSRMPKLKNFQNLRRNYEQLVDGKLSVEDFNNGRKKIVEGAKLKRSAAFGYALKVIHATQVIRDGYVKDVKQGDLVAWAIRGLYRQIDEKIPADVQERLDKIRDLSEADLSALLADIREQLGQREDLDNHKDIDYSLQQMLKHLDPYTTYIDPETLSRFKQETEGNFRGIGISIQQNFTHDMLQVVTPLKGSPAYYKGIKAGDLIESITRWNDDKGEELAKPEVIPTKGMTTSEAVKKIQGKPGTKVKVTVKREGVDKPLEFEVTRAVIELESVLGFKRKANDEWDYVIDPENRICYVRLTGFARNTAEDLRKVVSKLAQSKQGIKGFVLDLRFNPGGLLTSAVEISDLFIEDGLIVTIKVPRAGKEAPYHGQSEGSYPDFPMVCLVNNLSASGSEIVAACLQDHGRAVIAGERSYGKGSVQNIQPFEGGELKLTTASFWRPNGKNLNKSSTAGKEDEDWGVSPNPGYGIKLSEKERELLYDHLHEAEIIQGRDIQAKEKKTDFKDRQLDKALEYLRGQIKTAAKVAAKKAG